jgi:glucokinase
MNIWAVDVGGTKTHVGLARRNDKSLVFDHIQTYCSTEFQDFHQVLDKFSKEVGEKPDGIGIGAAGPVRDGVAEITNLPWRICQEDIGAEFKCKVRLINDLEAHAFGLEICSKDQLAVINEGAVRPGHRAMIAAGTGLGEALMYYDGDVWHPMATEGGHCSFAPVTPDDMALHTWLARRLDGHVSWERVVSGKEGFRHLAQFLLEHGETCNPVLKRELYKHEFDWGPMLIQAAYEKDPFANRVLRWFAALYGSEAGNLALKSFPVGGLFLGGGIAPRIIPWLKEAFMVTFTAKGRFESVLMQIPVQIILDPHNGLKGAGWSVYRKFTN